MKLTPLMNLTEARASDLLQRTLAGPWQINAQTPISSVICKEKESLSESCFSMLTSGRFDFLIVSSEQMTPVLAIEIDGPTHLHPGQMEKDRLKDALCAASGLPLCRLPVEVTNRHGRLAPVEWIAEQFAARQSSKALQRREARLAIGRMDDQELQVELEMAGSPALLEVALRDRMWRRDPASKETMPAVRELAETLWRKYAIVPCTFWECSLLGNPECDGVAPWLWLFLDKRDPAVAGFYVLRLEDIPEYEEDGYRVLDWERAQLTKPEFHASSSLFQSRGLNLWDVARPPQRKSSCNWAPARQLRTRILSAACCSAIPPMLSWQIVRFSVPYPTDCSGMYWGSQSTE